MKKTFLFFFLSILTTGIFAQDTITNKDIILMKTSKMNNDIIQAKINSSQCDFDLSTSGLLELKNSKIIDRIIAEMLMASPPKEAMTNDDVVCMYQAKLSSTIILAKIDVTEHDFDVSPEGLIKLTTAKIPKSIVKKMMDAPTGRSENDKTSENTRGKISSEKILKFEDVTKVQVWRGYDQYIAKDGSIFKKGDKITLNLPANPNGNFQYVYRDMSEGEVSYLDASFANKTFEIFNVFVTRKNRFLGSQNTNFVEIILKRDVMFAENPRIDIENAIASGEVKSKTISENEALENIKTAKDKFDLGLISEEEYEIIREEMKQYIK